MLTGKNRYSIFSWQQYYYIFITFTCFIFRLASCIYEMKTLKAQCYSARIGAKRSDIIVELIIYYIFQLFFAQNFDIFTLFYIYEWFVWYWWASTSFWQTSRHVTNHMLLGLHKLRKGLSMFCLCIVIAV